MSMAARQPKAQRKGPAQSAGRPSAWTGARASPTFSAAANSPSSRPASAASPTGPNSFPPLGQVNGAKADSTQDRVLQSLAGLTGTTITLTTKTAQRFEGVIASTNAEGDTTGVTLKGVKDISDPSAALKEQLFIASTNIESWSPGSADAKVANGESTFRTDGDISGKKIAPRERELQAWQPDAAIPSSNAPYGQGDDETFGLGSSGGGSKAWDQFAANEMLFGVTASFDEDVYTTKLDRSGADFREREKKAQKIANEILGASTNNPHIADERGQLDDSGANEEDKYGAVVRGQNAYIPPGARKAAAAAAAAGSPLANATIPKVSVNGPDGASVASQATTTPSSSKAPSPAPAASTNTAKSPADSLTALRDFVTTEKQRLTQRKQALLKNDMDKRMAELINFSQSFKLNKPIPDDLVPILAKDEEKQRAIKEKSTKDAKSTMARSIGPSNLTPAGVRAPQPSSKLADPSRKPSAPANGAKTTTTAGNAAAAPVSKNAGSAMAKDVPKTSKPLINMVIQPIPPFKGKPANPPATKNNSQSGSGNTKQQPTAPMSPVSGANRLNVNASSFRPNPKANAFTPGATSPNPTLANGTASSSISPKPKDAQMAPNAFFGPRSLKKGPPVNIKDDFNPFKHNKVVDASAISAMWPYSGKRYAQMFPTPQHPPPQHSPHIPAPIPPPIPPPSYEEDQAAAAARGGYLYYPPYGYPAQPMMPGMPPPGPPGTYIATPYMQPIPYPPGAMPPNAMYMPPGMQMPPPGAYMPPPPGQYPPQPPNGAQPRPSMPPTPIPAQAHPYYHQSPQLPHAVPYPMMMPPPPPNAVPPHPGYEGQPAAPPVPLGGAHP